MMDNNKPFRTFFDGYRWDDVDQLAYKEEGAAPFKDITRQVLFAENELNCEMRYFEMAANGYSTLERHEHVHAVMILRGHGHCLVGQEVKTVKQFDLIQIPPMTWHQFRATGSEPLGFLCMVNTDRDRPQLPTPQQLDDLKAIKPIAKFLNDGS